MQYLTHPALNGDGTVVIATERGPVPSDMREGIIAWPDGVEAPIGYTAVATAPEALIAARRAQEEAEVRALAAKLGLTITEPPKPETKKPAESKKADEKKAK